MKRCLLLPLVLVGATSAPAAPVPLAAPDLAAAETEFAAALAAQKAGDIPGYRAGIERAAERLPDPTRLLYRLAAARLADGDRVGALAALARQIDAGFVRDPRGDAQFASLDGDPELERLMARMDDLAEPVVQSLELFRIAETGALFEGIARHPFDSTYFLSSVHRRKIVRRAENGTTSDLVASGDHGLAAALGLAVDRERRLLWIVSAGLPQAAGLRDDERDKSALLAVDLDSGELRRKVEAPPGKRWWNDLVLKRDGTIFVSDSGSASIARIAPDGTVSPVVENVGLRSPGGLALSEDERLLYVADWTNGLAVVNLAAMQLAWLRPPPGATLLGIDGLRRVGSSLIAIQNGVVPHRITRFELAGDGLSVSSAQVLERAVPGWDEPTLGIVVDGALVYVANSQWPKFGEDGQTPDAATLQPTAIRRLPLTP